MLPWMCGRQTLTIVVSSPCMTQATMTVAVLSPLIARTRSSAAAGYRRAKRVLGDDHHQLERILLRYTGNHRCLSRDRPTGRVAWPSCVLRDARDAPNRQHADRCPGSAVNRRRRPIGGAASEPVVGVFAIVIDGGGLSGESGPVIEAIGVDDGARTGSGLADRTEIDPAAPADQELGGARAEAVAFDERPVLGLDRGRPARIARRARAMGTAERTEAGAQRRLLGWLR